MFQKVGQSIKTGFNKARNIVSNVSSNFPKLVQKAVQTSKKIADGAESVRRITNRAGAVYEKNKDLIKDERVRQGINRGINTANKVVDRIKEADAVVSRVGNSIFE
jgi:hypothetical protein